jgi:hypothetical protein
MLSSANLLPFLIVAGSCRFMKLKNTVQKPCRVWGGPGVTWFNFLRGCYNALEPDLA